MGSGLLLLRLACRQMICLLSRSLAGFLFFILTAHILPIFWPRPRIRWAIACTNPVGWMN